jgi:hypothetical protein
MIDERGAVGGRSVRAVECSERGLTMRIVLVIGVVLGGVLLASCSSTGAYIGDNLPEWAGGLPKGTPPRPGSPGYDAYLRDISGDHTATAVQPAQPNPPPRDPKEPAEEPIH